jgi:hypothetical protein
VILVGLMACTSGSPRLSGGHSTATYALKDCPVSDRGVCKVAVVTVNAIADEDASAIVSISRPLVIRCGGVPSEFYPDCTTDDDVLKGYVFTTGMFPKMTIDVLGEAHFLARLQDLFQSVDRTIGIPIVLGIKRCGGSWTLTWVAPLREAGGRTERMGGFFEFVTEDRGSDTWFTEGLILMPLRIPAGSVADPADRIACDDPAAPWPS